MIPGYNSTSPGRNGSNIERPKDEEEGRRRTRPSVVEIGENKD